MVAMIDIIFKRMCYSGRKFVSEDDFTELQKTHKVKKKKTTHKVASVWRGAKIWFGRLSSLLSYRDLTMTTRKGSSHHHHCHDKDLTMNLGPVTGQWRESLSPWSPSPFSWPNTSNHHWQAFSFIKIMIYNENPQENQVGLVFEEILWKTADVVLIQETEMVTMIMMNWLWWWWINDDDDDLVS